MKKFNSQIVVLITALLFCGCVDKGPSAKIEDLTINGIFNRQLLLDGTEGRSSTFSIKANHDWQILDYKGFSCEPSSGTKSIDNESITITVTPLKSNNTADTIRLSALNFKLLSTRFIGITAYQLPQIIVENRKVELEATGGAKASFTFKTKCDIDDIELTTDNENIVAKVTRSESYSEYTKHTVTITSLENNISSEQLLLGRVGFKVNGVVQEKLYIDVMQAAAISFDRSIVLLPGHAGGENMFVIQSKYAITTKYNSDKFTVTAGADNCYFVRALAENTTSEQILLGEVEVSLRDIPESKVSIEVHQRKSSASQTIMAYFVGTALGSYYDTNAKKILEALNSNIQGDARVLITFTDSTSDATLYELRYDNILKKAVKEKVCEFSLSVPYSSQTFEENIRRMKEFAPAEKYALVIGSHGHAWTPKNFVSSSARLMQFGVANPSLLWQRPDGAITRHIGDNGYTVQYDITEITSAIEANNIKYEYILFDACFMGNVETVYELRNTTKYIIGSPCEVMGAGFPYAKITPYMLTEGGASFDIDKICKAYVDYYRNEPGIGVRSACVAVTNTAELEALATAVKSVNQAAVKEAFSLDNVQIYDGINSSYNPVHIFYDLEDMVEQSCADDEAVKRFKTQLSKTVTSRYNTDTFYSAYDNKHHNINHYSGITTSAGVDFCAEAWQETAWYKATH
uniref:clostripain-related cysteine peptidase n=1 Tax=Alistipes sp. TaxID=1872444 RepID=UPI004056E9CF